MNLHLIIYLIVATLVAALLGYELRFTEATKWLGFSIYKRLNPNFESSTGYQNAITPPWSNVIGYSAYLLTIAVLVYGFYSYGWLYGIVIIIGFLILTALIRMTILPSPDSEHFYQFILSSMFERQENYEKSGDLVRAEAMSELLDCMEVDVLEFKKKIDERS